MKGLEGDKDNYKVFLKKLGKYLRGYFMKRMQGAPDFVEDLVQEVLLAVHNKRHTYDRKELVTPWLHAIAKYKYIDFLRKRQKDYSHDSIDDVPELFAVEEINSLQASRDIETILKTLPDHYRVPLELTKIGGLSIREAAESSGMSESAIKIGVHRGLQKLALKFREATDENR